MLRNAAIVLALVALVAPASADQDPRRWRLAWSWGGIDATDEIRSDSANVLTLVDASGQVVDRFLDPRTDGAVDDRLTIEGAGLATLAAQYAAGRRLLVEASIGYQRADVGEIEVHRVSQFSSSVQRLDAGELTRVPLQLSAFARFRPDHSFRPHAGGGLGFSLIGFDPSAELDELSRNMDLAEGRQTVLVSQNAGSFIFPGAGSPQPLDGARVDARDSFEWHLAAGAEYDVSRRWAVVGDLRWTFFSREFALGFNGGRGLGNSVPQGSAAPGSPAALANYGPMQITRGGLIDVTGDGRPDGGLYYVQGGRLSLGSVSLRIGVRFAF